MSDQQRHIDAAVIALTHRLRPWASGMQDPQAFAREFITALVGQNWRCIPAPAVLAGGQGSAERYKRGAAEARRLLGLVTEDEEQALQCPVCPHQVSVSAEDGDAALSEMHRHLRADHPDQDPRALLASTTLTREDQQ